MKICSASASLKNTITSSASLNPNMDRYNVAQSGWESSFVLSTFTASLCLDEKHV